MTRVTIRPQLAASAFEPHLPERFQRVGILAATASEQQAHEWSRIESGVFTYEILSGLSGAADVNGDGLIEYSELAAFVAAANREFSDPRAVPSVIALPPRANLHAPLVRLADLKDMGVLTGDLNWGHFYVELENGLRVVDVHAEPGRVTHLHLPMGRFFVVAGETEATATLGAKQVLAADALGFTPRAASHRGSVEATLSTAFFKAAFSRAYYQGYVDRRGEPSVSFSVAELSPAPLISRRGAAWLSLGSAVVLGIASVGLSVGAAESYRAYQQTSLQRPAAEAVFATNLLMGLAIGAGAAALGLGVVSWRLWSEGEPVQVLIGLGPSSVAARLSF